MSDTISIRPADLIDVPAMAAIRAMEWERQDFWVERIESYLRGDSSPQKALEPRAAWVAVDGEHVMGFVAGHLTRRFDCDGELQWINVANGCRGEGIARRLMTVMMDWFRSRRAYRVCVNVAPENAIARSLYAHHGASPLSRYWMVWEDIRSRQLFYN